MIENLESRFKSSDIKDTIDHNRNMEAERPMRGIEQPFIGKQDVIDSNDIKLLDSERTIEYLPEEPVSFVECDEKNDKHEINEEELQERTGWPDEVTNKINSMEEAQIYEKADLQDTVIDGKHCLIRTDIDLDQVDEDGISNRQRMERGRPPITKDGKEVELHHIGQKQDSPLAELTMEEHRGIGNDTILHDKTKESEINRIAFAKERKDHWKSRVDS